MRRKNAEVAKEYSIVFKFDLLARDQLFFVFVFSVFFAVTISPKPEHVRNLRIVRVDGSRLRSKGM